MLLLWQLIIDVRKGSILKQIDITTNLLFDTLVGVSKGEIQPKYGMALSSIADTVIKAALSHSIHQKAQKKIPYVMFFDDEIKSPKGKSK